MILIASARKIKATRLHLIKRKQNLTGFSKLQPPSLHPLGKALSYYTDSNLNSAFEKGEHEATDYTRPPAANVHDEDADLSSNFDQNWGTPRISSRRSENFENLEDLSKVHVSALDSGRAYRQESTDSPNEKWLENVNDTISKLAAEALHEVERIRISRGFVHEDMKQTVWQVLRLFRNIARDQKEKKSQMPTGLGRPTENSPEALEVSIRVNNTISTLAQSAKDDLEVLGRAPMPSDTRRIIGGLVSSYFHLMETHSDCFTEANIVTMVHRIANLSNSVGQSGWVLRQYNEFISKLLYYVQKNVNRFDAQGYATIVWSLGRFGPLVRTLIIDHQPFDKFLQEILEASRKEFPRLSTNDALNIILGLAETGVSQMIIGPYLRGLLQLLAIKASEFGPDDLAALIWGFSQMRYTGGSELITRLCDIAEKRLHEFTPYTFSSFLRGLTLLDHNGTPSLNAHALTELERRIDEFDYINLSRSTWALLLLSQHPHGKVLDMLGQKFLSNLGNNQGVICSIALAYAHAGEISPEVALAIKRHFTKHSSSYRPAEVCKLLWALATLQELDDNIMNSVENTTFATLSPHKHGLEGKRQLCQVLISWRLENKKTTPRFVSRELEEACYSAWRTVQKSRMTFGLTPEVMSYFSRAGFDCRSPWIIETVPICVTSAILSKEQNQGREVNAVLEIMAHSQVYVNRPEVMKPRLRWRSNVLKALGWVVLHIYVDEWHKLDGEEAKARHLENLLFEASGETIKFSEFLRSPGPKTYEWYKDESKALDTVYKEFNQMSKSQTQDEDECDKDSSSRKLEDGEISDTEDKDKYGDEFDFSDLVQKPESTKKEDGKEDGDEEEEERRESENKEEEEVDDERRMLKHKETRFSPAEYGRYLKFSEDDSDAEEYEMPLRKDKKNIKALSKNAESDEEDLYSEEEVRSDEDDPFSRMRQREMEKKEAAIRASRRRYLDEGIEIERERKREAVKVKARRHESDSDIELTEKDLEYDNDNTERINDFDNFLDTGNVTSEGESEVEVENQRRDPLEREILAGDTEKDGEIQEISEDKEDVRQQGDGEDMDKEKKTYGVRKDEGDWADPYLNEILEDTSNSNYPRGRQGRMNNY